MRTTAANQIVISQKNPKKLLLASEKKIICDPVCREESRRDDFYIIEPVGSLVNNQPKFSWTAATGATSYIVRLQSSTGTVWELEVNNTEISYPENQPPLEPGKAYNLIVKAIGKEQKETQTRFILLTTQQAEKLKSQIDNIRNQNLTPQQTALKIAELYEENNLITEAKNSYQQALELAKNQNDIDEQAWIQVKLARINLNLDNSDQAIILLRTAFSNYETSNNQKLSSQVAQFLGEIYNNLEQKKEAIRWYQQAKAGYEKLKTQKPSEWLESDQKRLEWVEKQLRDLN
ncbi:tetratricopeptide repeat protein [Plectonema cf. radiosum LEGE 06105]|uniref:Tetratricopeptide repeat protein n=1 Tax=Plectonema cf. radiosum LEGE 06105 TaxID=945769 RepID=A0A8J7F683_9CYAN|nr:tetratricopeptide repeat protein [Plectonema radiosum]MBE9216150.1 tetratricopeptide repeat protein [Plectonema cf. radiosum LEGE 06105]